MNYCLWLMFVALYATPNQPSALLQGTMMSDLLIS